MKNTNLILCLIALVLSACNQENSESSSESGLYQVSLKTALPVTTRLLETANGNSGLITSWDNNDSLSVLYTTKTGIVKVAPFITSKSNNGIFTATNFTDDDRAGFSTNTVYAVNRSGKISASKNGLQMAVSVDLSSQNGALGNVAKYDMMYATGKTNSTLNFNHQMCVLRFDVTSTSLLGTITGATFNYTPSGSTSNLFASGASYFYGPSASSSTTTDVSTYSLASPSIAVTNNSASIYLVVPARTSTLTGTLSMTLTCSNGKTFSNNISVSGKSFNAQHVVIKALSLSEIISNCYRIPSSATGFTVPVSRVNEFWGNSAYGNNSTYVIGSTDTWTASVIWQDVSGLVTLTQSTGTGPSGKIVINTSSGTGNVLIGLKKTSGTGTGVYLWSWHLWVTNYDPNTTNAIIGNYTFMDRNLGATSNTSGSTTGTCGLYYQWGRKDPFYGSQNPPVVTTVPSTTNLVNSVQNPTTLYMLSGVYDWYANTSANQNNGLWGSSKTIYDPCPAGWKTPPSSAYPTQMTAGSNGYTHDSGTWWPRTGVYSTLGTFSSVGSLGYYWSSTYSSTKAYSLNLYNSASIVATYRTVGCAVRCVKE